MLAREEKLKNPAICLQVSNFYFELWEPETLKQIRENAMEQKVF